MNIVIILQSTVNASRANAAVILATKSHPVGNLVKHVVKFSATLPLQVAGQLAKQILEIMFGAWGIMNAIVTLILIITKNQELANPK